jgi:hypothetical protein
VDNEGIDMKSEEEWPEYLEERAPANDIERIDESFKEQGIKVKSRLEGTIKADLEPGDRIRLHWSELVVEAHEAGVVSILVEGEEVWKGPVEEIEDIRTYSSSIEETLCGVCINGRVVWIKDVS